jgi:uncharacterized protein
VSGLPVPVTAVFAALFALMLVALGMRVARMRLRKRVSLGDGGDKELGAAIRIHGNFIEYVPMALALMAFLEWAAVHTWIIYAYGALLLAARTSHAFGLHARVFPARTFGIVTTWALLVFGALAVLVVVR